MKAPQLFISDNWSEYQLIDCGDGNRLERWGDIMLVRPDPQALWPKSDNKLWKSPHAIYKRSSSGGGKWDYLKKFKDEWTVGYGDLSFKIKLTGFKHTGLFPEQAVNWDKITQAVSAGKNMRVLNLFGYTGAASVAAAKAGADVCHVDSSKGMLTWCRENAALSGIADGKIRLIPEDCLKFVEREIKRGNRYDAIIMDPPSFGRGAKGEVWKLEDHFWKLLTACKEVLSDKPSFMLINSYTAGISSIVAANMLSSLNLPLTDISYGELGLKFGKDKVLPCGITLWGKFS